jgi:hypothetical protein
MLRITAKKNKPPEQGRVTKSIRSARTTTPNKYVPAAAGKRRRETGLDAIRGVSSVPDTPAAG